MEHQAQPRLVLPSLMLKSVQHEGKFKHSGKHVLINGRWHKLYHDAKAPKHAPVAYHPHAHQVAPGKHLSDEEWDKLKLDPSNVNAGTYHNQLAKLKEWSEGGHAAAILGHGYGVNSYGKKLSHIANHLLGKMGSQHQVAAGQKAGEHEAIKAPEHEADAAPAPADHKHTGPTQGETTGPSIAELQDQGHLPKTEPEAEPAVATGIPQAELQAAAERAKAKKEPAAEQPTGLAMPEFQEGKTVSGVKDYYEKVAKKVIEHAQAGNVAVLEDMKAMGLKPNGKGKVSNTWSGKTPNSKILLALHKQALAHAKGGAAPAAAEPAPAPKPAREPAAQAGTGEAAADALDKLMHDIEAAAADGDGGKATKLASTYVAANNNASWAISDAVDALQAAGLSDAAKAFKDQKDLNDADEAKAKQIAQAPAATPAPAADTGALSAAQLQALQSIPWHKLKLPDTNKNAKSHNGKMAKIEAMAFAGDVAGLEAFKAGVNTYGKIQNKTAQTALAALKENAQTQVSQSSAPAAPSVTPAADAEGKPFTHNGYTYKKDPSSSTGWSYLMAGLGKWHEVANAEVLKELPGAEKAAADAGGLPQKPTDLTGYKHDADDIELALMNGDAASVKEILSALGEEVSGMSNLGKVQAYGKAALAHLEQKGGSADSAQSDAGASLHPDQKTAIDSLDTSGLQAILNAPGIPENVNAYIKQKLAAAEAGPKDGDTKQGADGMLVFKDGRWHKVKEQAEAADASPAKPQFAPGSTWNIEADKVSHYLQQGDVASIEQIIAQSSGKFSPSEAALHNYAKAAKAHLEAKAGQQPAAAEPEPAAEQHPIDAVPIPDDIKNAPNKNWSAAAFKSIEKLKEKLKAGDADVLKGATKFMSSSGKYIVKLPHYNDSYSASGLKSTYKGNGGAAKALYEYVESLKAAMGKPAKKKAAAKPAAAAPAPVQFGQPESMDSWVQTGGQGGSNPGGKFKDQNGVEWYCKFPDDDDTAKSEVLAAKLYAAAGLAGQDAKLITKGGKLGIASKWVDLKKAGGADALAKVEGVHAGFGVDAWLANWDVVGLSLDNLQIGPDGKAMRVDAGGSLEYRAQGAKKPFGNEVQEIDTLLDAKLNPKTAAVFGSMTEADKIASVAKVLKISDVAIRALVNQYGPGDAAAKQKLADTLIARKADLAKKFPQAAKSQKKVVFKPEEISAPPSFTNWGGSGKSGPSSKEFVNQANEEAVQSIFAAGKTGDIAAVQNLTAKTYDKNTGAVTGEAKVLEHPSQHVKGYAQQVINEINYQLNPPKKFRFEGGHPLHALNDAYPAHHGAPASATAQKLGKYIVLGEPGTISADDLQLPPAIKHTSAGGTLTTNTYAKAAQAAVAKMPKTQQQAIQSYTGASYHEMNGSLWSGNPTGAAKAAGEALKTLGHDIEPGTLLSRKISLHGPDLDALLKSTGKVLQEPAIMSTSIRPSSWSGNVQLKLRVGPGVKGLWVGHGSLPGGGAMSKHAGEDEMILPPNTRLMVVKVSKGADADGFGAGGSHVIECVVLPTQ